MAEIQKHPLQSKSQIRRRYTRIAKYGKVYAAYLQIGCQGFCVVDDTTKQRANWYRDELAAALENLLAQEKRLRLAKKHYQKRKGKKIVKEAR